MVVLNFKRLNQTELAAFTNNVLYRMGKQRAV